MPKPEESTKDTVPDRAAACQTDSGPSKIVGVSGDSASRKMARTQTLVATMPFNATKASGHGFLQGLNPPPVGTAKPESNRPGGSTLSEKNAPDKTGEPPAPGVSAGTRSLGPVRPDATGQRLTLNQGPCIADNQNSPVPPRQTDSGDGRCGHVARSGGLFEDFEKTRLPEKKKAIVTKICTELKVHTHIEDEIFYPAFKDALKDHELVPKAHVEHASVKDLIAQAEGLESDGKMFDAKVKVTGEFVKHHVKEEQTQMLPKAKKKWPGPARAWPPDAGTQARADGRAGATAVVAHTKYHALPTQTLHLIHHKQLGGETSGQVPGWGSAAGRRTGRISLLGDSLCKRQGEKVRRTCWSLAAAVPSGLILDC